jgi:uncharacterized membrane protein YbhN (UPF0104 family)
MSGARRFLPALKLIFVATVLVLALRALLGLLGDYRWNDFLRSAGDLPKGQLTTAIVVAMTGYLVMTGYDAFAFRYIDRALLYRRIALASFTGYAINNNIGLSGVVGTSLRYRYYRRWGLSSSQIAKVFVFCTISYWLGFALLGGVVFLLRPPAIGAGLPLRFASVRTLGALLLVPGALYLFWICVHRAPLRIRGWELPSPKAPVFIGQVIISMADWVLAGVVFYLLLPEPLPLSFIGTLGIFLLAQVAGLVSNVPGGIGVFEAVALLCLRAYVTPISAIGALLMYRGIYLLMPLIAALLLLTVYEAISRWKRAGPLRSPE